MTAVQWVLYIQYKKVDRLPPWCNLSIYHGRSVIIGLEKSQSYQRFVGCQQEVLSQFYNFPIPQIGISIDRL